VRPLLALALVALLSACGGAAPRPIALADRPAIALPTPLGALVALTELPDATIVVGQAAVAVIRGGAVIATTPLPSGARAAATITAPDGEGRWALLLAGDGHVYRIAPSGELRDVTAQLGLGDAVGRDLAGDGATLGIALDDGVAATTDGHHLARFAVPPPRAIAATAGTLATLGVDEVTVWDLTRQTQVHYAVPGATALALVGADHGPPRLAVASPAGLYVTDGAELRRRPLPAAPAALRAVDGRLWIRAGDATYTLDGAVLHRVTGATDATGPLLATADGELWRTHGDHLEHPALLDPDAPATTWQAVVAPVVARVCIGCHGPNGEGGLDLSTAAAWDAHRDSLRRRVILNRSMPPPGTSLADADRAALARWLR
jgi:hypothetical protein